MRKYLQTFLPMILGLLLLLVGLLLILDPIPPKQLRLATGAPGAAFHIFGQRYVTQLANDGVQTVLHPSEGSAENIALLAAGQVDAALAQNGGRDPDNTANLQHITSLGNIFLQPLWVFYRQDTAHRVHGKTQLNLITQLQGWRLNIGAPGSGVRNLMLRLLDISGLDPKDPHISMLKQEEAARRLQAGELDAMAFASNQNSPLVQQLLHTPGIGLLDFAHAETYSRRLPQIVPITIPPGLIDLQQQLPPQEMHLIAVTASLLVRHDLHPALQALLVREAQKIHAGPDWFQRRGEFPNPGTSEFPLDDDAAYVYRHGPSRWERWLPFWAATFMDRMGLAMISIALVVVPLLKFGPKIYVLEVRWRIYRSYQVLNAIDNTLNTTPSDQLLPRSALEDLLEKTRRLEDQLAEIAMPSWNRAAFYSLKSHIGLVQRSIQARMAHT